MAATFLALALAVTAASSLPEQDPAKALDFWVGSWVMDSSQPADPETKGAWQPKACKNTVTKVYGGKVILESFSMTGFTGGSWSVYDPAAKRWKQTWVDDSGGYMLFEGGMKGKEFVLEQRNRPQGKARMRFTDIRPEGFNWYWESSTDGKTWKLNWHLKYVKAG